jgi:hypothetical protein
VVCLHGITRNKNIRVRHHSEARPAKPHSLFDLSTSRFQRLRYNYWKWQEIAERRQMAYEIIKHLQNLGDFETLELLRKFVSVREKKNGKPHSVFQPSFDAQLCLSEKFTETKLRYMHFNPISGKWNLSDDFLKYSYSSAKFYEKNEVDERLQLTHYKEFIG